MKIRQAREADAPSVIAWFTSHADAILWGGPAVPANFDVAWFAHEITATSDAYRTAQAANGDILGIYGLRSFAEEQRVHIIRLAVAPAYRGKGLGRILIADAIALAVKSGTPTISLNVYGSNTRARRLYEELGFRASKTRDAPEDASGVSVFMEHQATD